MIQNFIFVANKRIINKRDKICLKSIRNNYFSGRLQRLQIFLSNSIYSSIFSRNYLITSCKNEKNANEVLKFNSRAFKKVNQEITVFDFI